MSSRKPPVGWVVLSGLLLWVQCSAAQRQCNGSAGVRLTGGLTPLEGRVEICFNQWYSTCGEDWGAREAAVVCRELGYNPKGAGVSLTTITPYFFPIRLRCTGNEARLRDCNVRSVGQCIGEAVVLCQADCETASGSGLIEDDSMLDDEDFQEQGIETSTCGPSERFCAFGSIINPCNFCIPESAVCDTIPDCRGGTDEELCAPPPDLEITHRNRNGSYFVGSSLSITCTIRVPQRAIDLGVTVSAFWTGPDGTILSNSSRATVSDLTMISSHIYQTAVSVMDLESSVDSGSYTCNATLTPELDDVMISRSSASRTTIATVEVPPCTDRSLRLVNMRNTSGLEGRVEICYNGQWGTVCGSLSSNVVCRQLGHSAYGSRLVSVTQYGLGTGPIWLNFIRCNGESDLSECAHRGVGVTETCSHSRDIAVECLPAANCSDGEIRLVDGLTEYNGWVQICFLKTWGTICSNLWDDRDATVACNQLGYSAIGARGSQGFHSPSRGPVWLERVMCNGTETSIIECRHNRIQQSSCGRPDAQAFCQPLADCLDGEVRLVNGSVASEGRVELCINRTWGKLCPRGFYGAQAAVVCRQLGFPTSGAHTLRFEGQTLFGRGTRPALLSTSLCNGTESSLLECQNTVIEPTEDCSFYGYDATVMCGNASNCNDGDIRTAVTRGFSGVVQVCFGGEWGFVCPDDFSWSSQEGLVACRQLGFKGVEISSISCCRSDFDSVYIPYLLSNVNCNGTESNLIECSSSGLRLQNCQRDPASLTCSDPPPCVSPGEHECQFGTPYGRSPCISETRLCDGYQDCNGGTDEMNCPGIVTVGWTHLELSAHESGRSAHRSICLQVLQGVVVQPISVTIYCDSETAKAGIDFKNFTANITFYPEETMKCHLFNASDIIVDDLLLEFTEHFDVYASPTGDDYRFVEVDPDQSTATIFITDDEIVKVGFDSPVYSVNEGDGEVRVSVRRFGEGVELGRPITVRVSSSEGNATAGTDYDVRGVLPQIAELGARSSPSHTWDIFIPIVDDSVPEGLEFFVVELFVNDVAVTTMQASSTVVIADDDDESVPEELKAYFTGDTPRIEGSTVVFQVETNKPASVRCHLSGGIGAVPCSTRQTTTTGNLPPGTYILRAIANAESQRAVAAVTVTIPDEPGTCTVNLINRGVSVREDMVSIEFGGAGPLTGYSCSLDRQPSKLCTSPLQLSGMSEGDHILRVTTEGCGVNKSGRMILHFTV